MVTQRLRVVLAVFCILGLGGTISSHEVPVHWEITSKAVDYLTLSRREIQPCAADLKIRLGEGVGAEDDYYEPRFQYYPLGNFMFHFTPQLKDRFFTTFGDTSAHADCDSQTWGHAGLGSVCSANTTIIAPNLWTVSGPRTNAHSYSQVVADLKTTPGSAVHNRGLKGLGHYLHLLQDLASPAHTRNDAHPHFFSIPSFKHFGDPSLFEVVNNGRPIPLPTKPLIKTWTSPEQAFSDLQQFTSSRFWSEKATLKDVSGPALWDQLDGYAYDDEGRRIAYRPWFLSAWTINDVVAREQFDELAPEAVRYTASMIDYIIETEKVTLCEAPNLTGTWRLDYSYGAECSFNSGFEIIELLDDGRGGLTGTISGTDYRLGPTTGTVSGTLQGSTVHLTRKFATGFVAGATRTFDGVVSGNTMTGHIGTCGSGATPPATYIRQ